MNIELDEVAVQDVSDDALELAAGVMDVPRWSVFQACSYGACVVR
jgi:hypothetical protein